VAEVGRSCWGRGAGAQDRVRGAPGPPPASAGSFVLCLPTTCLSSGPKRTQRKARPSRGGGGRSPQISTRGALSWEPGVVSVPVSLQASLPLLCSLFCCFYSSMRHSLGCLPLPLGSLRCGRPANTVSCPPANSGPVEWSGPRSAHRRIAQASV
jgi:hypothetical protein